MSKWLNTILLAVFCGSLVLAAPVNERCPRLSPLQLRVPSPTVPYASDDPNHVLWNETSGRPPTSAGQAGGDRPGPQDKAIDLQNPDILAPPSTDSGTVGNAKWPFSLSKMQLNTGGWVRQQNGGHILRDGFYCGLGLTALIPAVQQMPLATAMAGVDMRLEAGAIRELHWHQTAEWAYVIKGSTQITSIDSQGRNYVATVNPGDLWYFPPGMPHSLQATNDSPEGSEFLLIFPDGNFNDDDTFLLTDWLAHLPKEVIAKNFQDDISDWDEIPGDQLYIFPGVPPPDDQQPPSNPQGTIPQPFSFEFSKLQPTQYAGGTAKIADSTIFNVSTQIAVAEVTVEPGAMRELHWHPTQNEWGFFLEGHGRVTLFAANGIAQTFDYQPGDISYIPTSYGHYVENIGNTTLRFLEIFNTDVFEDVSLAQWLALTPPALVKQHLKISDATIARLNKTKGVVVAGKPHYPALSD
ncbi:oxalate decarboxylase [Epithele typhae]|uniref:oxalate decarboxylase n=1 Tax=Epithele typhae TaxID=378194 RepID=UPI0020079CA1|nr:oxalate decarboxylase [Epithele typhae]KAH9924636.1 oxalate decarboxylase [Epithele typhae]